MNVVELKTILKNHKTWVETNWEKGTKADLRYADLRGADLRYADLRYADLRGADLRYADLNGADLIGANLRGADLRYANLDYSCLPLWCGSLDITVDKRIAAQIAYHFCRLVCDDEDAKQAQEAIAGLANQFHRMKGCGKIEKKEVTE